MSILKKRKPSAKSRKLSSKSTFNPIKKIVLSAQGMPIVLSLTLICILLVLFRMKGVEANYQISELNREIEKYVVEGKELRAKKARLLSSRNLHFMAKKYSLGQPKQSQIIVVP